MTVLDYAGGPIRSWPLRTVVGVVFGLHALPALFLLSLSLPSLDDSGSTWLLVLPTAGWLLGLLLASVRPAGGWEVWLPWTALQVALLSVGGYLALASVEQHSGCCYCMFGVILIELPVVVVPNLLGMLGMWLCGRLAKPR